VRNESLGHVLDNLSNAEVLQSFAISDGTQETSEELNQCAALRGKRGRPMYPLKFCRKSEAINQ
jgi:hypothetical protein